MKMDFSRLVYLSVSKSHFFFIFKDFSTITMQIIEKLLNMVGTLSFSTPDTLGTLSQVGDPQFVTNDNEMQCVLIYVKVIPLSKEVLCP